MEKIVAYVARKENGKFVKSLHIRAILFPRLLNLSNFDFNKRNCLTSDIYVKDTLNLSKNWVEICQANNILV